MNKQTTKLVTPVRFRQLVDCYGSSSSSWPENERQAALFLLRGSPDLNSYREQTRSLDKLLERNRFEEKNMLDQLRLQMLHQHIMNQLPDQASTDSDVSQHRHTNSSPRTKIWMGSLAASLFIVSLSIGVIQQLFNPTHDPANLQSGNVASNVISTDFTLWAWEDITGETWVTNTSNDPTTLFALVEMELPAE